MSIFHSSENKHQIRRKRNIVVAVVLIILLIVLTFWEYQWLEKSSPAILALLNLNGILLLSLIVLICRNLIKLYVEYSQQAAGSRFRTKLVLAFTLLTLIPTVLLAVVGTNLMATSIKNWFEPQVGQFISDAMEIARLSHGEFERRARQIIDTGSRQLGVVMNQPQEHCDAQVNTLFKQYTPECIQVFDSDGFEICRQERPDIPSGILVSEGDSVLQTTQENIELIQIIPAGPSEFVRAGKVIMFTDTEIPAGFLFISIQIRSPLTSRIRTIQRNFEAYNQQKQSIRPTKGLYVSVFLLIALTILFATLWVSLYFARQISEPISHLSDATQELARGNYDYSLDIQALDELGDLVRSFNSMIEELRNNRNIIERTTRELQERNFEIETRRHELEVILSTIKAGVIAFDSSGCIQVINSAACAFLDLVSKNVLRNEYRKALNSSRLTPIVDILDRAFIDKYKVFQNEIQLESGSRMSTFSINVTPLSGGTGDFNGVVLVINDLTHLLKMQRIAAWREVARRLAHEIKNPLTPIQLNTQRMQKKFQESSPDFSKIFHTGTESIIKEVLGLRQLLDEFSRFARLPEATKRPGSMNEVVLEVLDLYAGKQNVTINLSLSDILPVVHIDRSQMKRVVINLIDNAIESMQGDGSIEIRTEFRVSTKKVRLEITDDGPGVPDSAKSKLFLPYFSTKGSGSGLGLAICNRIIIDHDGRIRVVDNVPRGARLIIELPAGTADVEQE